jgi:hypothetical protein
MGTQQSCDFRVFAITAVAAAALVACGGGGGGSNDDGPVAITGVVADGPLSKAVACYDTNDNLACDAGEPTSAPTDADGNYRLEVPRDAAGRHAVIVNVPADAVDKDTGAAVGTAFVLKAPATGGSGAQTVFVSPLTTLVVTVAQQQALSAADATAQVQQQLGLTASPLANFVSGNDASAAALAATLRRVTTDVTELAASAGANAAATQALVDALTTANLPGLAARVREAVAGGASPTAAAEAVSTALQSEANLTPQTAAAQAQVQALLAAPLVAQTGGAFVSVPNFSYTDANNYSWRAFVGDSSQTDAQGRYVADEVRITIAGGAAQPFNRNRAYWTGSAWQVCERERGIVTSVNQTATAPASSVYCDASRSQSRVVSQDISGRRMADVITEMRAFPLPDSGGLPTAWGPDPALLGDAVFPDGSALSTRATTLEIGSTDSYGLLDKVLGRSTDGVRRHLASFDDEANDPASLAGNFVNAGAVVSGANAAFLDQYTVPQPADATLRNVSRWMIAFEPSNSNRVRFYQCDVVDATGSETNCAARGDGTVGEPETRGDARVVRITAGYPAALIEATKRQRFFIERDGAVLRGSTDLQRTTHSQRLNTTAWTALRQALGIPAQPAVQPPAGPGPFVTLRSFTFTDAANYSWRETYGDSSQLNAQGYFNVGERRETRTAGVLQPFVRNRLYWTGTEWFECPSSGDDIIIANSVAPFDSLFCRSYTDEPATVTTITLDGRLMGEVARDIRRYGSKDGTFDYRNWGPDPAVHTQLASAVFPAGSTMSVRGNLRKTTPETIAIGPNDRVRVAPADTSIPFDQWPFAASLEDMIAKYPGDYFGATPSGSRTLSIHSYTLAAPPAPEYTTQVRLRVSFDANGQKVRFWRAYVSATTGNSTAFTALGDSTYTIETVGGKRLLRFASLPAGFEADFLFARRFAEHAGGVYYAFKDSVTPQVQYSLRLNVTARNALFASLGI